MMQFLVFRDILFNVKVKKAMYLCLILPFMLCTSILVYCIYAVATNRNYSISARIPCAGVTFVQYVETAPRSGKQTTRVQCIASDHIFDPHQKRYDVLVAEGTPIITIQKDSPAENGGGSGTGNAGVLITIDCTDISGSGSDGTGSITLMKEKARGIDLRYKLIQQP